MSLKCVFRVVCLGYKKMLFQSGPLHANSSLIFLSPVCGADGPSCLGHARCSQNGQTQSVCDS